VNEQESAQIPDGLQRVTSLRGLEAYALDQQSVDQADRLLDVVEAGVLLARGRTAHLRFLNGVAGDDGELMLFERAVKLCHRSGDVRREAEALFWIGTFHQTVRADHDVALPHLQQSLELAKQADDSLLRSCVERHLGFVDIVSNRVNDARTHLETSVQLRREIGFTAGVAAGLVALAELEDEAGHVERSRELLDEAQLLAESCSAEGVLRVVDRVRGGAS
jgi:hypothetical protein